MLLRNPSIFCHFHYHVSFLDFDFLFCITQESTIEKSDAKLKSKDHDDDDSFKQEMGNIMIAEKSQSTGTTQNMSEELQVKFMMTLCWPFSHL